MRRRSGIAFPGAVALGLAVLLAAASAARPQPVPRWWDIEVRLTAKGRYSLTEGGTAYAGDYLFREAWWGSMEKDEDDYRLFHARREILDWKFQEKAEARGAATTLTEKDCPAGPSFRINYVLKDAGLIRFFIVVDEFPVPRNPARARFDLLLPRSKTDGPDAGALPYDGNVTRGSNDIAVEEKAIRKGPTERVFLWEWKAYQPGPVPESGVVLFNSHQAEIRITVTPRFESQARG
jgi:hypothetical protein